ncbi:MAG: flagellar biosynthesis protein FliQ [Planctomycetes bacterium]|nr:flagellar biosynthesis protein FliQ [Planctomycetota bacterium]
MAPQDAIDVAREAIVMMLTVSAPVLVCGLAVGLLIGILQAMTQVQESTLSFVPKIVAMLVVLGLSLPWLIDQMVYFSRELITNIPRHL